MKLSAPLKEAEAMQVFRLVNSGLTVDDACNEVGITRRQYYYWISRADDAIEGIKGIISEQERLVVTDIATARAEALRKIAASIYEENNIGKLMSIESHLRAVQREIENRHGMTSMDRSAADFMLTGPSTKQQESRTSISVEPNKDGKGVTLNISSPEVIDLEELNG